MIFIGKSIRSIFLSLNRMLNRIKKSLNENKTLQTIRLGEMELDVQHIDAIQQASNAVALNSGKRRKITTIGHQDTMSRW